MSRSEFQPRRSVPQPELPQSVCGQQQEHHALGDDCRRSLNNALIASEIRHLGARLTEFCQKIEPFLGGEVNDQQRSALVELYTRFSAEIDLLHAAAHQVEGGGEIFNSFTIALRSPLEEGIRASPPFS